jgi:hypothetical protein
MVSWFGLQHQAGFGLSGAPQTDRERLACDTRRDLAICFTWKQVGLEFPSLASRLVEARLQVVNVASSRRSSGVKAEDGWVDATGYIGPFYSKIIIFYVLDLINNLVFNLLLEPINRTLKGCSFLPLL